MRSLLPICVSVCASFVLVTGCTPPAQPHAPEPAVPPPVAAIPVAAPPAPPPDPHPAPMYLSADAARGSPLCFDPASPTLRAAIAHKRFAETDRLGSAALADDVHDLHAALRKIYAGYPELLQDRRFDVDAFFATWERDVRASGATIAFGDGVLDPLIRLRHHVRDNHFAPWGWGLRLAARPELAFSEYQTPERVEAIETCDFGALQPVHGTPRAASLVTAAGLRDLTTFSAQSTEPAVDVRCGARTIRFERRRASRLDVAKGAPYEWKTVGDATVIVVRRLEGSPEDEKALERIAAEYDAHARKPVVVFDFRGNGGGNDGYVNAWIDHAVRGTLTAPYIELRVSGAERACGDWNNLVADQLLYDRADKPDAKAERDTLWQQLGSSPEEPPLVRGPVMWQSDAKHPYQGRVFALVDHGSASSGETAPDALRVEMHATLVGERTGGFTEYGNVRPIAMPRTGVMWQVGSKRNYYDEPTDGVGMPVDYYLPPELIDAPVEQLLPLLEALPKKTKKT